MSALINSLAQDTGLRSFGVTSQPPLAQRLAENTAGRMQALAATGAGQAMDPQMLRQLDQNSTSLLGELRNGFAGAGYSMLASSQAALGQIAEPFAPQFAKQQIAGAIDTLRNMPQDLNPAVEKYADADSLYDKGLWAAHALGSGVGSMLPMLAGSALGAGGAKLLGRAAGTGAFVGGTAAGLPAEAGETALQLHNDPAAMANTTPLERTGLALGRGVASSALETVVPMAMGANILSGAGKAAGKGLGGALGTVGRYTAGGTLGEYGTEFAQDLTGQTAMNLAKGATGYDYDAAHEAGLKGAVTGGVMGMGGGGVKALVNQLPDVDMPDVAALKDKFMSKVDGAPQKGVDAFVSGLQKIVDDPKGLGEQVGDFTLEQLSKLPEYATKARKAAGEGLDKGGDVLMDLKDKLDNYVIDTASPELAQWYAEKTADFGSMTAHQYNELVTTLKEADPDEFMAQMGQNAAMWGDSAKRGAFNLSEWAKNFTGGLGEAASKRMGKEMRDGRFEADEKKAIFKELKGDPRLGGLVKLMNEPDVFRLVQHLAANTSLVKNMPREAKAEFYERYGVPIQGAIRRINKVANAAEHEREFGPKVDEYLANNGHIPKEYRSLLMEVAGVPSYKDLKAEQKKALAEFGRDVFTGGKATTPLAANVADPALSPEAAAVIREAKLAQPNVVRGAEMTTRDVFDEIQRAYEKTSRQAEIAKGRDPTNFSTDTSGMSPTGKILRDAQMLDRSEAPDIATLRSAYKSVKGEPTEANPWPKNWQEAALEMVSKPESGANKVFEGNIFDEDGLVMDEDKRGRVSNPFTKDDLVESMLDRKYSASKNAQIPVSLYVERKDGLDGGQTVSARKLAEYFGFRSSARSGKAEPGQYTAEELAALDDTPGSAFKTALSPMSMHAMARNEAVRSRFEQELGSYGEDKAPVGVDGADWQAGQDVVKMVSILSGEGIEVNPEDLGLPPGDPIRVKADVDMEVFTKGAKNYMPGMILRNKKGSKTPYTLAEHHGDIRRARTYERQIALLDRVEGESGGSASKTFQTLTEMSKSAADPSERATAQALVARVDRDTKKGGKKQVLTEAQLAAKFAGFRTALNDQEIKSASYEESQAISALIRGGELTTDDVKKLYKYFTAEDRESSAAGVESLLAMSDEKFAELLEFVGDKYDIPKGDGSKELGAIRKLPKSYRDAIVDDIGDAGPDLTKLDKAYAALEKKLGDGSDGRSAARMIGDIVSTFNARNEVREIFDAIGVTDTGDSIVPESYWVEHVDRIVEAVNKVEATNEKFAESLTSGQGSNVTNADRADDEFAMRKIDPIQKAHMALAADSERRIKEWLGKGGRKGETTDPFPERKALLSAGQQAQEPRAEAPVNVWHGSGENADLSNLAARPFTADDKKYHSVEHAYQTLKSGEFDQATYERYESAGRKIAGTKGTKTEGGWNLQLMKRLVKESFLQNPDAAQVLLATGNAPITHTQDKGVWSKEFPRILMEVRSELQKGGRKGETTGRDLGDLPMHYKMPPNSVRQDLRAQYPNGTTTAQLMADGHRTATTRRAFGEVGDTFTVGGVKYRITALEQVDMDTAEGREKWSQREGWDADYARKTFAAQVRTGAVQTVFERVGIVVNDHQSSGYRERTKFNADSADLTVAVAKNFATAGERLTKSVAGDRYKSFGFDDARTDGRALAQEMQRRGAKSLNVAGNGIYTLTEHGMTQEQVNQHIYDMLSLAHGINPISKIVSGGQTGVDIAGAVAARALGIPAVVTLPRGFVQRNAAGEDRKLSRAEIEQQIEAGAAALTQKHPEKAAPASSAAQGPARDSMAAQTDRATRAYETAKKAVAEVTAETAEALKEKIDATTTFASKMKQQLKREVDVKISTEKVAELRAELRELKKYDDVVKFLKAMLNPGKKSGDSKYDFLTDEDRDALYMEARAIAEAMTANVREGAEKLAAIWARRYSIGAKKVNVNVIVDPSVSAKGHYQRNDDGSYTLTVNLAWTGINAGAYSTLSHEFGHVIELEQFAKASDAVKARIMERYEADKADAMAKGATANTVRQGFAEPWSSASMVRRDATVGSKPAADYIAERDGNATARHGIEAGYTLSFSEWFANQFAKHTLKEVALDQFSIRDKATESAKGGNLSLTPGERGFWKKAIKAVRDFFHDVVREYRPDAEFSAWIDDLAGKQIPTPPAPAASGAGGSGASGSGGGGLVGTGGNPPAAGGNGSNGKLTPSQEKFVAEIKRMLGGRVAVRFNAALAKGVNGTYEGIDAALKRLTEDLAAAETPDAKQKIQTEIDELQKLSPSSRADALRHIREKRRDAINTIKSLGKERSSEEARPGKDYDALVAEQEKIRDDAEADEKRILKDDAILGLIHVASGHENVAGLTAHEAFHAAFQFFFSPEERRALATAFSRGLVKRRLLDYYANMPEVVEAINNDPEEAAAYGFQLWSIDPNALKLGETVDTYFGRFKAWLRKLFSILTAEDKAKLILNNLASGERSERGISPLQIELDKDRPWYERAAMMAKDLGELAMKGYDMLMAPVYTRIADMENPALTKIARALYQPTGEDGGAGMIQRVRRESKTFMNTISRTLDTLGEKQLKELQDALIADIEPADPKLAKAKMVINFALKDLYNYQVAAGVKINDASGKGNYYPLAWDEEKVLKNKDAFFDMLKKYDAELKSVRKTPDEIWESITSYLERGKDLTKVIGDNNEPINEAAKTRSLAFISREDRRAFMSDDPTHTMMQYIKQAVRQTEYVRAFGEGGRKLNSLISEAKATYGATVDDIALVHDFIDGALGAKEAGMSRELKDLYGFINVYQNYRMLPFSLFSSLVDPMGVGIRSNNVGAAWETFTYSLKNLFHDFRGKNYPRDQWEQIAEDWGIIEASGTTINIDSMYDGVTMRGTSRKLNDALFKYNLLNGWVKSNTIMATKAAQMFFHRAAEGKMFGKTDSKRYLDELGLKREDVIWSKAHNRVLLRTEELMAMGFSQDTAQGMEQRLRNATEAFVRQALLQPSAAELPAWASNPYLAPIAHLKSFVWAFNETITKRLMHELEHGNYKPIMMAAAYVPMMIGADWLKDMISNGGEEPAYKKNWGIVDYTMHGIERSGLTGTGAFISGMKDDVMRGGSGFESLSGPTLEQLKKAAQAVGSDDGSKLRNWFVDALPLNPIYDQWLGDGITPRAEQ